MLGHRALTTEDVFTILKRRRWLLILPALVLSMIAVGITYFIPARYTSQTLVIVEEQKVPDDYVKPVVSADLDSRLASMKEQILSRSRLQPIIERYNLYAGKHYTMDDRLDEARKSISVKPIQSQISKAKGLPGFFISFTASDARTAQLVCGEISFLFLSENLRAREATAEGTTDFLKGQLEDAKRSLDEQDSKLATFQRQYIGRLPGEEGPNMNMMTSLNTQLEAATQALARMEQDKSYLESMLAQQTAPQPTSTGGIPAAPSPAQLAQQTELAALLKQEADLAVQYTADYPDLISTRRRIADLRRQISTPPAPGSAAALIASRTPDSPQIQQMRAQLRSAELGIADKRREQERLQSDLRTYQERVQSSPLVQEQFKALTRDHDTAQKFYDDLLTKMNHSKMATDLERRQEGEQFRVMDEPNLPDEPTFPKKWIFAAGGFVFGLALSVLMVGFLEYRDTALRTERDVWAFTKLPTLAVIAFNENTAGSIEPDGELPLQPVG